jgi:hypothetical protein
VVLFSMKCHFIGPLGCLSLGQKAFLNSLLLFLYLDETLHTRRCKRCYQHNKQLDLSCWVGLFWERKYFEITSNSLRNCAKH